MSFVAATTVPRTFRYRALRMSTTEADQAGSWPANRSARRRRRNASPRGLDEDARVGRHQRATGVLDQDWAGVRIPLGDPVEVGTVLEHHINDRCFRGAFATAGRTRHCLLSHLI